MIRTHYFYGCSMTAGDELSDGDLEYPFKMGVTPNYIDVKTRILNTPLKEQEYFKANKKAAYPAILGKKCNILTTNIAENGMSLRQNILKILSLVTNSEELIASIFLQIPILGRELFLTATSEESIQLANKLYVNNELEAYRIAKLMSHSDIQSCVEDITDLVLLDGFLKLKNIKFTIIDINNSLNSRFHLLIPTNYQWMYHLQRHLPILKVTTEEDWCFPSWHMNPYGHEKMADLIKTNIIDKL